MVLACPQSSLPMMLKLLFSMECPVVCEWLCMGEGCLRCSFLLSPSDCDVSPMFSSSQSKCWHWSLYITPLLLSLGSWSLGFMRTCLIVVFPLKCTYMPYLSHVCFILLAIPFVYGMTICPTVALFPCLLFVRLLPWLLLLVSSQLLFRTFCWTLLEFQVLNWVLPNKQTVIQ